MNQAPWNPIRASPFNVGHLINLKDFTTVQLQDLASRYGLALDDTALQQLRELVGGHPYLSQQALYLLAKGMPIG